VESLLLENRGERDFQKKERNSDGKGGGERTGNDSEWQKWWRESEISIRNRASVCQKVEELPSGKISEKLKRKENIPSKEGGGKSNMNNSFEVKKDIIPPQREKEPERSPWRKGGNFGGRKRKRASFRRVGEGKSVILSTRDGECRLPLLQGEGGASFCKKGKRISRQEPGAKGS